MSRGLAETDWIQQADQRENEQISASTVIDSDSLNVELSTVCPVAR